MSGKRGASVVISALLSAAGLIGLAFYRRMPGAIVVPETASYIVQAVIVLAPSLWAAIRRAGRSKARRPN